MANYEAKKKEFQENSKSTVATTSGLKALNNEFWNDTDYQSKRLVPTGDGVTEVSSCPAKELRDGLKKVVSKTFGVDSAEIGKLDSADLPKAVTDPMIDGVMTVQKDYLNSGRGLVLPMTDKDETIMKIQIREAGEKTFDTKKIVKDEKTGKYESVPTGERVTNKRRKTITGVNKVPAWLQTRTKSK